MVDSPVVKGGRRFVGTTGDDRRSVAVFGHGELIGDALTKIPFVHGLREVFTHHRIVWISTESSHLETSLAPLLPGLIDRFHCGTGWGERPSDLLRPLPVPDRFDVVIDTQNLWWRSLLARRLRHRVFISGLAGYRWSDRRPAPERRAPRHVTDRLFALLEAAAGRPVEPIRARDAVRLPAAALAEAAATLPDGRSHVALAPGAGKREKCWPLGNHVALAGRLASAGHVPVILLGPAETEWREVFEREVAGAVFPLQAEGLDEPRYTPVRTIAMARRCVAAVAGDCGLANMLAVADIPLLSLFGPTDAAKLHPRVTRGAWIDARDFGGRGMERIPPAVVDATLAELMAGTDREGVVVAPLKEREETC